MRHLTLGIVALAAATAPGLSHAAPTETVIRSLGNTLGQAPVAGLVFDAAGNLYGTTAYGGGSAKCSVGGRSVGCGAVFELTPPASGQTQWADVSLHKFPQNKLDGEIPTASLIVDSGGSLYGTTSYGGGSSGCPATASASGCGTVFRLTPPVGGHTSYKETILHSFSAGADGAYPLGALIADSSGAVYGTTSGGGAAGLGTVFKLVPTASGNGTWTETILYSFTGGADGAAPAAPLVFAVGGSLFGTTTQGGGSGCQSGAGCGTIFRLTPPASGQTNWTESVLYAFAGGTDGATPKAGLLAGQGGVFFGTTEYGGSSPGCSPNGCGTAFKLFPPVSGSTTWRNRLIFNFSVNAGILPLGGLIIDSNGVLYGTTSQYGQDVGNVFSLTPPALGSSAWTETILHSFTGSPDGDTPAAGLIADANGNFYGTTESGGAKVSNVPRGAVFEVVP